MAKRFRPKSIFRAAFRNAGNGKESPESQKMMRPEFEGLQPSDFKNTSARTTWRGRNQLGGAELPTDNFVFNLWAFAKESWGQDNLLNLME